jgi:hypothetical protein
MAPTFTTRLHHGEFATAPEAGVPDRAETLFSRGEEARAVRRSRQQKEMLDPNRKQYLNIRYGKPSVSAPLCPFPVSKTGVEFASKLHIVDSADNDDRFPA